jgi:hypothetical protein
MTMERLLLTHLLDVSIRSLALAIVAAAALGIMRQRSAAFTHAVWTAVLFGMLLLFAIGPALKPLPVRMNVPLVSPRIAVEPPAVDFNLPVLSPPPTIVPVAPPHRPIRWSEIAAWTYVSIAFALLGRLSVGWWLARRLFTTSVPVDPRFRESPLIAVPVVGGWPRPSVLLPPEWRDWDQPKLEAVLAHESAHVRRRDSLTTLLAGVTRSLFWFHPLAWWIEHRLALLAEQACDEACLCMLKDRREYARLLLEMASAVEGAGARVPGHVLAMARPSQVHRRIDAILDETRAVHPGLTRIGWTAVLLCSVPVVYTAGTLRMEPPAPRPPVHLPILPIAKPETTLVAQVPAPPATPANAPQADASPVFTMVSVQTPDGRYVTGLRQQNFRLMEGYEERSVTSFAEAEGQHAIGVVLTTTADVTSAVDDFQKNLHPEDESFVVQAGTAPVLEAISAAVAAVRQRKKPAKALVVITQGAAKNPAGPEPEVSALVRKASGVSIYIADIADIRQDAPGPPSLSQEVDLTAIARISGGQYFSVANPAGLTETLHRLAGQLSNGQYMLGFVPGPGPTGRYRRLNVDLLQVQGLPPLHVTSPWGYIP